MKNDIIRYIERNSSFEYEKGNSDERDLTFTTRENGDVGEEEYSEIDFKEGETIEKLVLEEFKGKIETDLDTVDEWVCLDVTIL